mmetsp:Transcript_22616/g.52447  ORF Transcript_22616/g.52447 Transcript_22616/m.52447 type:complete len:202 (-) Transcript_22616:150-755(-)
MPPPPPQPPPSAPSCEPRAGRQGPGASFRPCAAARRSDALSISSPSPPLPPPTPRRPTMVGSERTRRIPPARAFSASELPSALLLPFEPPLVPARGASERLRAPAESASAKPAGAAAAAAASFAMRCRFLPLPACSAASPPPLSSGSATATSAGVCGALRLSGAAPRVRPAGGEAGCGSARMDASTKNKYFLHPGCAALSL